MLILPQIVYNELDVFYLTGSQAGYIQHLRGACLLHFPAQQIVGADVEEIRNSYQHIYGRHDIIIFPITDTLLFHSQLLRKLNLIQFSGLAQIFNADCKHNRPTSLDNRIMGHVRKL